MEPKPDPEYVDLPSAPTPQTYIISTLLETRGFLATCPSAQTYEAYSETLRCTVWIPLPCKKWSCRFCSGQKINHLAHRCEDAKPNRLLTLTVDPKRWESPRQAFDSTRRAVPELFRKLRLRFGEIEYLRVTELTKNGWPHYHCLVRSPYLPHSVVKRLWEELTEAKIVDLRPVKSRANTYHYLVKYLSKMHELGWTNRHVSYSRAFFPTPPPKKEDTLCLKEGKVLESHPATILYHQFRHSQLAEIAWNVFCLNPSDEVRKARESRPELETICMSLPLPPQSTPRDLPASTPNSQKKLF